MEEVIIFIRSIWSSSAATFIGRHYQIHEVYYEPRPLPVISLLPEEGENHELLSWLPSTLIGGTIISMVEEYAHKVAILKCHGEMVELDLAEIKPTFSGRVSILEDPDRVVRDS